MTPSENPGHQDCCELSLVNDKHCEQDWDTTGSAPLHGASWFGRVGLIFMLPPGQLVSNYYPIKLIPFQYMTTHQRHLLYSKRFLYGLKLISLFFFFLDGFTLKMQENWRKVKRPLITERKIRSRICKLRVPWSLENTGTDPLIRQSHQLGLEKPTHKLTLLW